MVVMEQNLKFQTRYFLDALASLDFKLSVSQSGMFFD